MRRSISSDSPGRPEAAFSVRACTRKLFPSTRTVIVPGVRVMELAKTKIDISSVKSVLNRTIFGEMISSILGESATLRT